jgi:hypothetical protein
MMQKFTSILLITYLFPAEIKNIKSVKEVVHRNL